jgi:hypothetical protein
VRGSIIARLLAQLLKEPLTDSGVSPGPLKLKLPLSLMRALETFPDHSDDAFPVRALHVSTLASSGCPLGRDLLGATIESRG